MSSVVSEEMIIPMDNFRWLLLVLFVSSSLCDGRASSVWNSLPLLSTDFLTESRVEGTG